MADWPSRFLLLRLLEDELAAELQFTRIVGAGYLSEVAIGKARIDTVDLRVVEGVEGFNTKLKMRILLAGERNALEQREIPVEEPGTDDGVFARGAIALVCAALPGSQGSRKRRGVEPLVHCLRRVAWACDAVRAIRCPAAEAEGIRRIGHINRRSRL